MSRSTRRVVLMIMAGTAALIWVSDIVVQAVDFLPFWMDDAQTYAVGGRHLLDGLPLYAPIQLVGPYDLADLAWGRGFAYPPTAALLFVPLAPFGPTGLGIVFGAALAALGLLAYRVGLEAGLEPKHAALIAFVLTASGPAVNAMSSGNANLLVADALLVSWLWPRSSGYLAVIGGLVKFFPAVGLVWTIRKHGSLRGPVVLGLGVVATTTLIVGTTGWHDFLTAFANGRSSSFYELPSSAQLLGSSVGAVVGYSLAALALAGTWRVRDERLAFALLGWAMILPAPDWWSHYFVVPLAAMLPLVAHRLVQASLARRASESIESVALPSQPLNASTSVE